MSILTELKKLTKKKNATVVSQALPDSLDGSGSGGGGANVLTLYVREEAGELWAYKNQEFTEEYSDYEEAKTAIMSATNIVLNTTSIDNVEYSIIFPSNAFCEESVYLVANYGVDIRDVYLWQTKQSPKQ